MCPLRRVEGSEAGPNALGLLLPPGRQTFLILRPRALPCDLLLLETPDRPAFLRLDGVLAQGVAQKVYRALQNSAPVEILLHPEGSGFRLHVSVGPFVLVVCSREAGLPYQPKVFPDSTTALSFGRNVALVLCPPADVEQEIYFNVRHFTP